MTTHILGKTLDPFLGIATGCLAFWLNEHNDQTAPPRGYSLYELLDWRFPREARQKAMGAVLPTLPKRDSKEDEVNMEQGLADMLKEAGYEDRKSK